MATHSSLLAWEAPWIEEPGGLQSMESQRVKYDLSIEHSFTGDSWDKDGLRHETFYLLLEHLRLSHQKGRNSKCHEANSS